MKNHFRIKSRRRDLKITLIQKYQKLIVYFLILAFGIVTYSLDLYPGGYQLDLFSDEQSFILTKKDITQSEQFKIEKTDVSTLKVLLIDNEVRFLKGLWLTSISVFAIWFIYICGQFEKKKKIQLF